MNITNEFEKSIKKELSLYFHFLDGYIDEDTGSITNADFIRKNILSNKEIFMYGNLYISRLDYKDSTSINLIYYNDSIETYISFDYWTMLEDFDEYDIFKNNYFSIQVLHDKHATSIVIFPQDTKLYLLLFNSGDGIKNHKNKNNMYVPYKGIIICEDINNPDMYKEAINKIYSIFLINQFYDYYKQKKIYGENNYYESICNIFKKISNFENTIFKKNDNTVEYKMSEIISGDFISIDDINNLKKKLLNLGNN